MKITLVLLLFIAAFLRADEEKIEIGQPDEANPPEAVELTPAEREAADLILKGDASAVAGDQENAMSFWGQTLSHKGAGEQQKRDATERLQWACPENGIGGWEQRRPAQAFALFRRDSFLGTNEAHRKQFIREFCDDIEHNEPHPEFDAYAEWLQKMLPEDKNFELLPLILEGDLAINQQWLAQVMPDISDYDFLLDPDRALQIVKQLGGSNAGGGFTARMLNEDGEQTLMSKIIDHLSAVQDGDQDKYQRTRIALKKYLASLKVTTLDSDLMLTLLHWDEDKALAKFLAKHGSKIATLETEQVDRLLQMLERVKGCPKKEDMDSTLRSGDACALSGQRERAREFWGWVMTLSPTGIVMRQDAKERLEWASQKGGIETWGPENAGQVFANHAREIFLGANAPERQTLIKNYCMGQDDSGEIRTKFASYALWIRGMVEHNKNLEVLPLILDGDLADHTPWLSQTLINYCSGSLLRDPPRVIKSLQELGFLGDAEGFRIRSLSEDGRTTVFGKMIHSLQQSAFKPAREAVKKHLTELQPRTLGTDLMLALLEKDEGTAPAALLKAHENDLARLPDASRQPVLDLLRQTWPKMPELSVGGKL